MTENSPDTPSVLYVEDSRLLSEIVNETLSRFKVRFATTYDEALELLEVQDFDFVLLDLNLPGSGNGVDLCKHIRDRGWEMPVFFTTAGDGIDRRTILEVGAQGLVPKNRDFETVLNAVIDSVLHLEPQAAPPLF